MFITNNSNTMRNRHECKRRGYIYGNITNDVTDDKSIKTSSIKFMKSKNKNIYYRNIRFHSLILL